jgi:hypothetical protein
LAPSLDRLGAGQLAQLSAGIQRTLAAKPLLDKVFDHEHANMLVAVQTLQDAYTRNEWSQMEEGLGPDARDAIQYLKDLPSDEVPDYFQGFAKEADEETARLKRISTLSGEQRSRQKESKPEGERPWRRFAKHFFEVGRPLLEINDETLARTRLLALTAELLRTSKAAKTVPPNLAGLPEPITRDPYSGRRFVYETSGLDFNVYSVGANFQDDGGETDESFSQPDLTLER